MATILELLHYVAPIISFLYFVLATLWSICSLQTLDARVRKKLHSFVMAITALNVLTLASQAAVITAQLISGDGSSATHHDNLYALSDLLVWIIMFTSLWRREQLQWYPYYGTWTLSLVFDTLILGLSVQTHPPIIAEEWARLAFQALRMGLIVFLLFVYCLLKSTKEGGDEETSPLIANEHGASSKKQKAENGRATGTSYESAAALEADDEAAKEEKKLKERMDKLRERLKEKGNWFTYLKSFKVFVPLVWPTKRPLLQLNMVGVALCIIAARVFTLLAPLQIGILTNDLAAGDGKGAVVALTLYIVIGWLRSYAGIEGLREFLWIPVRQNAVASMETASYNHIMELSCDFHDKKQTGELYISMTQGASFVTLLSIVLYRLTPMVLDLTVACIYFYFLFDAYLVLIGFSLIVLYFWVASALNAGHADRYRVVNTARRRKTQVMYDNLGGWRTVSYFNQIPHAERTYEATVNLFQKANRNFLISWYFRFGAQYLVLDLFGFVAFAYAAYGVLYGGKSVGNFVTLVTYWATFTGQLPSFAYMQKELMKGIVDSEELLRLFQTKPTVQDGENELSLRSGLVEVSNIRYAYDESNEIIKGISFFARPGQTVALIGETGAGKSTILKLLFRFYDVTSGSISIDGQDIRNVTLASLREHIGVVPQDPSLFNDTIMANVRYAKLDATDEEVMEACKRAAVHDKILGFKDGYKSKVGERGVKLSGGELQRVAIARAILKDPAIILLDEATSSVDSETEEKIQKSLLNLSKGRTTFVVAHRLSTIMNADRILVIRDGEIAEAGTPAQLMKSKGKYYSLWTKQLGLVDNVTEESEGSGPTNTENAKETGKGSQGGTSFNLQASPQNSSSTQSQLKPQAENRSSADLKNTKQIQPQANNNMKSSGSEKSLFSASARQVSSNGKGKGKKRPRSNSTGVLSTLSKMAKKDQAIESMGESQEDSVPSRDSRGNEIAHGTQKENTDLFLRDKSTQTSKGVDGTQTQNDESERSSKIVAVDTCDLDANEKPPQESENLKLVSDAEADADKVSELVKIERLNPTQQLALSRRSGRRRSLASIEEAEEVSPKTKIPQPTETKTKQKAKKAEITIGKPLSSTRDVAPQELHGPAKAQKPEEFTPAEVESKKPDSTVEPTIQVEATATGPVKKSPNARSGGGKKGFKPRPDAPEFVPKGQQKENKPKGPTKSTSSQASGQDLGGNMQHSGNINRDPATRRQQAKSDPVSGQSLKKIHDEWMAGLGENINLPDSFQTSEISRPNSGMTGHVPSRSTPYGTNRRRGRTRWRNSRVSSNGSEQTLTSSNGGISPSDYNLIAAGIVAPNPTPTGILTPTDKSPRRAAGEKSFNFLNAIAKLHPIDI